MRLVYYSLACLDASDAERRWRRSIQSLRRFNSSIDVMLFVYGTPSADTLTVAEHCSVNVQPCGDYTDSFGAIPRHWVPALARNPTLHKFLSLKRIPADNVRQVLYLDGDTFFLGDVEQLFARYTTHSFYAREEPSSRRSHYGYDADYIDEELLGDIAVREGLNVVAPYNTGVCLMNHGLWRELQCLGSEFCEYVWRLLTGASLWRPEVIKNEGLVDCVLHNASDSELRTALRYPSRNGWIVEEIAWWLTLGRVPHLTHGVLRRSDVIQNGEYADGAGFLLAHYYSTNEAHFFDYLDAVQCHHHRELPT